MNKSKLAIDALRKSIPVFNEMIDDNAFYKKAIPSIWLEQSRPIAVVAHYEIKYEDSNSLLLNSLIVRELKRGVSEEQWPALYKEIQFSFITETDKLRIVPRWTVKGETPEERFDVPSLKAVYSGKPFTVDNPKWRN